MFTRSNLKDFLKLLDTQEIEKIRAGVDCYEYAHLECSVFNAGAVVSLVSLSNDLPDDYEELISSGDNVFLYPQEILHILERN